jgi:vacuole morphology and inheritance protein 14
VWDSSRALALTCRKYLSDGNVDVRLATENVLAEFLREVKCIAEVQEKQAEIMRRRRESHAAGAGDHDKDGVLEEGDESLVSENSTVGPESDTGEDGEADDDRHKSDTHGDEDWQGEGSGSWQPGQGVFVDHAAIMDIIVNHLSYPGTLCQGLLR